MRQRVENSHSREQYMQILNVISYTWPEIYGYQYYFILGKEEKGKRQDLCLKRTVLQNVSDFCFVFYFSLQAAETTEGNYQLTIDAKERRCCLIL